MSLVEVILIAIGLAMDAFGVSVSKGLMLTEKETHKKVILPLLFGIFQMLMPIIGWAIGVQFADTIAAYDHWIILVLLSYLGITMIRNSFDDTEDQEITTGWGEMLMLSIATSVDAMAVGITFAFLSVNVVYASSIIGIITFFISLVGIYAGRLLGNFFKSRAEMIGGIILVLIGVKILIQHLGYIS